MDIPLNSTIGVNIKAGINNTDSSVEGTSLRYYLSPTGEKIYLPQSQFEVNRYSFNSWGSYYGLGLSYFFDKNNSVYLDWSRARSSFSNYNSSESVDINTDVTGLGFKHSF